jgi:hypothetical protein
MCYESAAMGFAAFDFAAYQSPVPVGAHILNRMLALDKAYLIGLWFQTWLFGK